MWLSRVTLCLRDTQTYACAVTPLRDVTLEELDFKNGHRSVANILGISCHAVNHNFLSTAQIKAN
jgi:hypothetical protein